MAGLSREERLAIHAQINNWDLLHLKKDLDKLEKKTFKKIYRESTRRSQKIHILPFIRRATPDGSGKKSYGRKSLASAGLRQAGGTRGSAGTYFGRKSTGKLRRDFKIRAMKRSRRITGTSTVNFQKTIFYGRLLEMGRTWNRFLPMREWKKVPDSQKGKGSVNWREGRWMWLATANRRKVLANNAVVRYIRKAVGYIDKSNAQRK